MTGHTYDASDRRPLGDSDTNRATRAAWISEEVDNTLRAWGDLSLGQNVEVELLVTSGSATVSGPRYVEGKIATATGNVLVIADAAGRLTRIPWAAIATIRDAVAPHPANR